MARVPKARGPEEGKRALWHKGLKVQLEGPEEGTRASRHEGLKAQGPEGTRVERRKGRRHKGRRREGLKARGLEEGTRA